MKPPWEWEEEDLLALISAGTQESIDLDYKRCAALDTTDGKKNEISKDVSAFANSAGGTIIYGIIEDGHVPTSLDEGYDPQQISKEWLEQVISSRVQRRIDGIRIKQVHLAQHAPGRVAYVVYIPQSVRAPHQASNKKFYKRGNFESVPMEEYEIRDIANRSDMPSLDVTVALAEGDEAHLVFVGDDTHSAPIGLKVQVANESTTPAEYAIFIVLVDSRLCVYEKGDLSDTGPATVCHMECHGLQSNWSPNRKMPIWRGLMLPLTSRPIEIGIPRESEEGSFVVAWQAHSPRMASRQGGVLLVRDGMVVRLQALE